MSGPTPEQIAAVQANVNNLIDLTNFVHDYAQDKINNAYLLQSQDPSRDPGQAWIDIILGGSIWIIGDIPIPGAGAVAGILSGIFNYYTTNTPPSLKGTFAGVWQRFDATFIQANMDLTGIHDDVAGNWGKTYKGMDGKDYPVSSLASAQVSSKDNQAFVDMANDVLKAFDLGLWKETLGAKWNIWITSQDPTLFPEQHSWDLKGWSKGFVDAHPAYRVVGKWYDSGGSCCVRQRGWNIWEYWLGANANMFSDQAAPKSLCDYLFKDNGGGNVVRPDALTTREDVFTNWKLSHKTLYLPSPPPPVEAEVKALPEGARDIRTLLSDRPREEWERELRKAAAGSPELYYELQRRPRETVRKLLGLEIPEGITLQVLRERHNAFYLVLPSVGVPDEG